MEDCPLCGSTIIKEYIEVKGWKIDKCLSCGIIYTGLRNKKLEKKSFYGKEYVEGYQLRETELKERFWQHLLRIERYKQGGRLLDVGCSLGYFLQVVEQSKHSWKVVGVEPNTQFIPYAKQWVHGRIVKGTMSRLPFKNNSFACVTCFDVLEHDNSLHKNIQEIKRVLKGGGILVIQSPNCRSLMTFLTKDKWDWWAAPDHVLHFSFSFLIDYLKQNGFDVLEGFTYENSRDFFSNIKGAIGKNYFIKLLFYLLTPILLLLERISWFFNFGALSFVILRKRSL